jgi:hypothetical protein
MLEDLGLLDQRQVVDVDQFLFVTALRIEIRMGRNVVAIPRPFSALERWFFVGLCAETTPHCEREGMA